MDKDMVFWIEGNVVGFALGPIYAKIGNRGNFAKRVTDKGASIRIHGSRGDSIRRITIRGREPILRIVVKEIKLLHSLYQDEQATFESVIRPGVTAEGVKETQLTFRRSNTILKRAIVDFNLFNIENFRIFIHDSNHELMGGHVTRPW